MAVQLELPVRPRGEPVVVVAVEDDRRVRCDPAVSQEGAEVLAAGDIAADPVGELAGPVPADGARQVALLVGGRVDIDLDEANARVVEVGLRPGRIDEDVGGGVGGGHRESFLEWVAAARPGRSNVRRWSRLGFSRQMTVGRGG